MRNIHAIKNQYLCNLPEARHIRNRLCEAGVNAEFSIIGTETNGTEVLLSAQ